MKIDTEMQRGILLELIARAHKTPAEVPAVEEVRQAVANAEIAVGDIVTEE